MTKKPALKVVAKAAPAKAPKSNYATQLASGVANAKLLALKLKGYHWNVVGPEFISLHAHFDGLVTLLDLQADDLAERLRALQHLAPGSYAELLKLASIKEENGAPKARQMVERLVADLQSLVANHGALMEMADEADDELTEDLLTQQRTELEKQLWMARSLLG